MGTRVFVSSTCYDLLDVRREIEEELRRLGLEPVLSDGLSSDFVPDPKADSIETCLVNLRACDLVLVILSQRYGPRLGKAGFEDISATHLEYREAVNLKKPLFVYARDRLLGDLATWEKCKVEERHSAPLTWVKEIRDHGIFELLREHRELKKDKGSNWVWPFPDSIALKDRIRRDLRAVSGEAILRRLLESGRCPYLQFAPTGITTSAGNHRISFDLRNLGSARAINVSVKVEPTQSGFEGHPVMMSLQPGDTQRLHIGLTNVPFGEEYALRLRLVAKYGTVEGHLLADITEFAIWKDRDLRYNVAPGPRRYVKSDWLEIETESTNED